MGSEKFRRELRQEAEQWRSEGWFNEEQYQQLASRYEFETLETAARDRFVIVLLGVGSILLGLGLITFVAANWQAIPRQVKVLLLLTLFVSVNAVGFYLWKRSPHQAWRQRLGQGFLLLGGLILGANMALMGQMFHRSGSAYELCLVWGLGVAAMAYGLRLTSLGVLSTLLMGLGYWLGVRELFSAGVLPGLRLMMQYMPLIAGALFLPLAYWCRSRTIFAIAMIAVISSLEVVLGDLGRLFYDAPGGVTAIAFALPLALLWGYSDAIWSLFRTEAAPAQPFRSLSNTLAVVYLGFLTYGMSFHWFWGQPRDLLTLPQQLSHLFDDGLPLLLNLNLIAVVGLTGLEWVQRGRTQPDRPWRLSQMDGVMLGFLLIVAIVPFWHWSIQPIQPIATFLYNVLLFLLAAGLMREGLGQGERRLFWGGMTLLTLQIASRMLEYSTGLLLKSLVLLLCGVAVIAIGLWFERYMRSFRQASPSDTSV